MTIERRVRPLELREAVKGSNGRQRWATAVTYGTVDDYGTTWTPGVFTEALGERMPTILYGHDWWNLGHVLGAGIDHREADYGVDVLIQFADPDEIPAARTAMYLAENKIIRDVSVGFVRHKWREGKELTEAERALGASEAMDVAGMDELSLVVRGAVPGAAMRSKLQAARRSGVVDLDAVMEIARRKTVGEITDAEAQAAIDLLTEDPAQPSGDDPPADEPADGEPEGQGGAPDHDAVDADLDAALAGRLSTW